MIQQVLKLEEELKILQNAFALVQKIQTVGPFQGSMLAQVSDSIVAVANSMQVKVKAKEVTAKDLGAEKVEEIQVSNGASAI